MVADRGGAPTSVNVSLLLHLHHLSLNLSSSCLGGSSNSADGRETRYATSSSLVSSTSLCFGSVANSPFMNQSAFNPEGIQQILMVKRLRDQIRSTTSASETVAVNANAGAFDR